MTATTATYVRSTSTCEFSEPTLAWCPPLKGNLGDTEGAPQPKHFGTPERFFQWLEEIWKYKVDAAKSFAATDFTRSVLLIDSFATICGSIWGSLYFQTLFSVFPDLSGPHFSFAANDNTIIVNWGFLTTNGKKELLVPSIDIFGFSEGLVNYRLSVFDVATLVRSLLIAYGGQNDQILEGNLQERMWRWHVDEQFARQELARAQLARR